MKSNLILYKVPIELLQNINHFNNIVILLKDDLLWYNIFNYDLDTKNIVLPIFNINFEQIIIYVDQYNKIKFTLKNLYNLLILNKYYNNDNSNYIYNYINNLNETFELDYNNININSIFRQRKFKIQVNRMNNNDLATILKDINLEEETEDYLYDINEKNTTNLNYKINNSVNEFTKEDINKLFDYLNQKQKTLLFFKLLISSKYYHYIINNAYILNMMKNIINNYAPLYRYLLSYTWIYLYLAETKAEETKSIKSTDNFIFDLNTASLLPVFPFNHLKPKENPYMPVLISDHELKPFENFCGIPEYCNSKYNINNAKTCNLNNLNNLGLCNLSEFKLRVNVFCTGNKNYNIFENFDFQKYKVAISGSIMAACLQRQHPLMSQLNTSTYPLNDYNLNAFNKNFNNFFNEYYATADIDIIFLSKNIFTFIDNVNIFYKHILFNIQKIDSSKIELILNKNNYLFVSENFILNNIKLDNEDNKIKYISDHINDREIKEKFKPYYEELCTIKCNELTKSLSQEEITIMKTNYPDIFTNSDDFKIYITNKSKNKDENILNCETYSLVDIDLKFSYKYNIKSDFLIRNLELFFVKYDDFFGVVSSFHLPCVRSYYDGLNVYLTPSCISAHLTYMNIDYKYIAGTKDPLDILNKYRLRGFGTWLNHHEKKIILEYSKKVPFWKNLYTLTNVVYNNKIYNRNINNFLFFGPVELNSKLFRPRLYNMDAYINIPKVETKERYNNILSNITLYNNKSISISYIIHEKYKSNNNIKNYYTECLSFFDNFVAIDKNGNITPIKEWTILSTLETIT
jgi:hypothetical protein